MTDKKPSRFGRIWSFLESPFTWGGIGVIVGAAATSPSWFKYAFVGAGVAIAVGALRAGFSYPKSGLSKIAATLACLILATVWLKVWSVIPKPTDPLTKQDLRDVLKEMLTPSTQSVVQNEPSVAGSNTNRELIRTKADLVTAVRQVLSELSGQQRSQTVPRSEPQDSQLSHPTISSVPAIFHDGEIRGVDFGIRPGIVRLHLRVKPSAQTADYSPTGTIGPDRLLGNLEGSNNPIVNENMLQGWSDHTIQLSLPSSYWDNLMLTIERVADGRKIAPPQRADLQVCYLVERVMDDQKSVIFCQE